MNNVHDFLNYRFQKTAASKAQIARADAVIKELGGSNNLSPEQSDRLLRARMVKDRQNAGTTVAHNMKLLRNYNDTNDRFGIGRSVAKQSLDQFKSEGKQIGDAKRAGKVTVDRFVTTPQGRRIRVGLSTMQPNVKDSGLTSKLQPTTRAAMSKRNAKNVVIDVKNKTSPVSTFFKKLFRR